MYALIRIAANDEAAASKHVEKKLFVKLNVSYKNKSHLAIKLTSELANELLLLLYFIKLTSELANELFTWHLISRYIKL